jgi:hypothetical protein
LPARRPERQKIITGARCLIKSKDCSLS